MIIFLGGAPLLPPDLPTEYYQSFDGCLSYVHVNSHKVNLHNPVNPSKIEICDTKH